MATFIVLLGPPGAGKGTQAQIISETMNLPHISTGDLFREHLKNHTELGKEAQTYMSKGQLVPDSLTIEMVKDRLSRKDCENGALLDGFPRTSAQAEAFDKMLAESFNGKVDCVPCIEVDTELLIDRLCGRWMCPNGHVFHKTFNPPKESGVCDICGCALYQRDDDKIETVSKRIDVYEAQTAPLIKYYEQQNVLQRIDGTQSIDLVSRDILDVLKKIAK